MTPTITNESELYVAPGSATYRLVQRFAAAYNIRISMFRRVVVLLGVTWVPMCVFALVQGVALGDTPRGSFLLDFATYVRYFLGIPVLIFGEEFIGARLRRAGLQFVGEGLVREEDYPAFERAIARLARRRESAMVTMAIIALAVLGSWEFTYESASGVGSVGWQSVMLSGDHVFRYNLAGLWSHFVALPVLLYLGYRWLWRIAFWTLFLVDVARMNLRLIPTHADGAGGLGFLEIAHDSFGIFAFAIGSTFSALTAFQVVYEGASIDFFQMPTLIVLAVVLILFLGPMMVFTPVIARTKRDGLLYYGSMVIDYNRDFEDKWPNGARARKSEFLGSSDIQSLADLGNSYRFVSDMGYAPFGRWAVVYQLVMALLPALPLILLVIPLSEILEVLKKVVL